MITHDNFDNNIDIHFKINNLYKQYKTYAIHAPEIINSSTFEKSISVFRIDMNYVTSICVMIKDSTHDLRVIPL